MMVLKILWQLPQVIVGGLVWLFFKITNGVTNKKRDFTDHAEISYKSVKNWNSGVSLSEFFIFIGDIRATDNCVRHESGHAEQSEKLGWFYLIIIGLPSISGNIYDRVFHKNWKVTDRSKWYYNLPWEKWADDISGVKR